MKAANADDLPILKPRHSAFFGTPLEFLLDELRITQLIIAGLTTDNCVMFTAHDAYLRKIAAFVPSNCAAARDPRDHRAALRHIRTVLKGRIARALGGLRTAPLPARSRLRAGPFLQSSVTFAMDST